jgi:guanylate cyclase
VKQSLLSFLDLGANPADSIDEKTRKQLFILVLSLIGLSAGVLGLLLFWHKEMLAGSVWLAWGLLQLVVINILIYKRRLMGKLVFLHLLLVMVTHFALSYQLGSFIHFGYAFYAMMAPVLSIVLLPKRTWWMAIVWILFTALGLTLEPRLTLSSNIPGWLSVLWFSTNTLLTGVAIFSVVNFSATQRDRIQFKLDEERKKNEHLLLSIFPEKIAGQLKNSLLDERTIPAIAEYYPEASVMFADIANFTPIASRLAPSELVALLNAYFSHFDRLAQKRGLEKIKTVGDCYIVAAGIPQPRADHASALVELALEIQSYARASRFADTKISFRIGINSGPLVAGVIGQKKLSYDLWGDTVNIASRMSSQGIVGGIQITECTYELLKDEFICIPRGQIFVKGKGDMNIWLLTGKRNS